MDMFLDASSTLAISTNTLKAVEISTAFYFLHAFDGSNKASLSIYQKEVDNQLVPRDFICFLLVASAAGHLV